MDGGVADTTRTYTGGFAVQHNAQNAQIPEVDS